MMRRRSMWSSTRRPDWIGRLIVGAGLACLAFAAWLFYGDWRFARDGRPVQGTVVAKEIERHRNRTTGFPSYDYVVRYRYALEGRAFEGEDTITQEVFDSLQAGGPVDVLYLPDAPQRSRLPGHTESFAKLWAILFGSMATFVGLRSGRGRKRGPE